MGATPGGRGAPISSETAGGLRPDEPDPCFAAGGVSAAGGRLDTRSSRLRWGHCAWASNGGACVWGGSPGGDPREVLAIGRAGGAKRERLLTTGVCPAWREQAGCASIKIGTGSSENGNPSGVGPITAHVVFGGKVGTTPGAVPTYGDTITHTTLLNDTHVIDERFSWRDLKVTGVPPPPRSGCCFVAISAKKVLLFGGVGIDETRLGDTYIAEFYEKATKATGESTGAGTLGKKTDTLHCAWRVVGKPVGKPHSKLATKISPPGRECASACFQPSCSGVGNGKGTVWIFGGCGGDDGESLLDDLWAFDVSTETWRLVQAQSQTHQNVKSKARPAPRAGHTANVLPLDALVDVDGLDRLWNDNAGAETKDSSALSVGTETSSKASAQTVMVVHGGLASRNETLADLWAFSFVWEQWRCVSGKHLVGFVPKPKACHVAVVTGARVLWIGGVVDPHVASAAALGEVAVSIFHPPHSAG
jgi:hypothetical protein